MSQNRPNPRGPAAALALLGAVLLLPTTASAGPAEDESVRQVALARADLVEGHADRARAAAESALRLDPTAYEALLVQALTWEATGELRKARALALAYAGAAGPDDEVAALVDRLDRADPVKATVDRSAAGSRVRFAARGHLEDPIVHWRTAGGAWQQAWMALDDRGQWIFSVPIGTAAKVTWWLEPVVGEPIKAEDGPFQLAVR